MKYTRVLHILKKVGDRLFSTSMAGLYIVLFAIAIGVATFIENDFGTSSAQKLIYQSRWFELLLVLFSVSLIVNIFRYRMIRNKKWAILTFHVSFIIILLGAAVTRYLGSEGMMHIREESASNSFLSSDTHLLFEATKDGTTYSFSEPVLFATLGNNNFEGSYVIGGQQIDVEVLDFIPNPAEEMVYDESGIPVVKVVIGGANGREEYFVKQGDRVRIRGTLFNFRDLPDPSAFNIRFQDGELTYNSNIPYSVMQMTTQQKSEREAGVWHPLTMRSLYSSGSQSFAMGGFMQKARVDLVSESPKMESTSMGGLVMRVASNGQEEDLMVFGAKGMEGRPRAVQLGDMTLSVAYGANRIQLPFSIALNDFIMEKYPGTNSASSYTSIVTLIDNRKDLVEDHSIYMNNILNYGGYRFFQSSFDKDELGTYLSVNHDAPGTIISYLGYALLTLGLILTFFSKKSRFRQLQRNIANLRKSRAAVATVFTGLLMAFAAPVFADPPVEVTPPVANEAHAKVFGEIVLQDYKGRCKPMNTHANEILRKLSRNESLYGYSAEQIILGMAANPRDWYDIPLIKPPRHEDLQEILGTGGEGLLAYSDFFEETGGYKLKEHVRNAYNTPQQDRGTFEKELLKLDERVNICSMVFSGRFMKVFPVPDHPNQMWISPADVGHVPGSGADHDFVKKFYSAYIPTIQHAMHDNNWQLANRLLAELKDYQRTNGSEIIPSEKKIHAELLLNKLDVFSNLMKVYGLLGLGFLALLFTSVFKPSVNLKWPKRIAFGAFALAFLFHLFGLGLRWYVSGRAPWSNGYESMIYIAFTTVLAGMIFSRKSLGGMAATNILASTILMVAGLSWLDPEITPLVPVLKSYWLTIHVSMEAGSYGFLMLGALIGVLNLIFMIFANQNNGKSVYRMVREMTYISEMTLIGGLVMISIGTYLGGVWANESWGRYWGWDAKETWALVTILVYAFILHMRFIPGFRGLYAFNVSTLFGWASVIMTYFGVNYYLSGLHSYAAGDPMPIPPAIFYTVITLTAISLLALWRHKVYVKRNGSV